MTDTTRTIDLATHESYLSEELDAVVVGTEVLQIGLNLSVAVSTEEDGRAFVVRRPNE